MSTWTLRKSYSGKHYYHVDTSDCVSVAVFRFKPIGERAVAAVNLFDDLLAALQALGSKPDGYCWCDGVEPHTGGCLEVLALVEKAEEAMKQMEAA